MTTGMSIQGSVDKSHITKINFDIKIMKKKRPRCFSIFSIITLSLFPSLVTAQDLQKKFQQIESSRSLETAQRGESLLSNIAPLIQRYRYISSRTSGGYKYELETTNYSICASRDGNFRIVEGIAFTKTFVRTEAGGFPTFIAIGKIQNSVVHTEERRWLVLDSFHFDDTQAYVPKLDSTIEAIKKDQCSLEFHIEKNEGYFFSSKKNTVGKLSIKFQRENDFGIRQDSRYFEDLKKDLLAKYPHLRSRIDKIL